MLRRRGRRAVSRALLVVVAAAAAGALYQEVNVRREARRFPPPGRLIDVGGRRLHLMCLGEGQPTVIFESSGLGGALSSEVARREISAKTRVCSYDRMGMGWSDPGPGAISTGVLTNDLETLLDRAGLQPPYVLVPASVGGLTIELFARRHRSEIGALVFVDAADSGLLELVAPRLTSWMTAEVCLARLAARLGIIRLLDPLNLRGLPASDASRAMAMIYRAQPMATLCGLVRGASTSLRELRDAPSLASDIPLVVLTAESTAGLLPPGFAADADRLSGEWREAQQRLARRSSRGVWRVVPGSDHLIGNSQPHAVAAAVTEMLEQARN